MRIRLSEVRSVIRNVLQNTFLIETRIVADASNGSSRYRVLNLSADGQDAGKAIIVPVSMKKYGQGSIDQFLQANGFQPKIPEDLKQSYAYDEKPDPEKEKARKEWSKSYYNVGTPILVDIEKKIIDLEDAIKFNNHKDRRGGGTKDSAGRSSYVIPHGGVVGNNLLKLQKTLKALMKHDKRVDGSFLVVGNPKYDDHTIDDVLKIEDAGNIIASGKNVPVTLYHGTSTKRWELIKKVGLKPNNAPWAYVDQVKGYSEFNIYLTTNVDEAQNYATRAAIDDRSQAAVLKVVVKDITKFVFDEDGANWLKIDSPGPPWTKNSQKGEEIEIHFRHQYDVPWQTWPNADKIFVRFQQKIIKNLHNAGTIGYKGSIPKENISLYMSYKPASMKKDPDDAEYDVAREKTFATLKKEPSKTSRSLPPEQTRTTDVPAGKQYKVYGRKGSAPAHTRHKGKVFVAGQDTKFRAGDKAHVSPDGSKLRVTSLDSSNTQTWEPEES